MVRVHSGIRTPGQAPRRVSLSAGTWVLSSNIPTVLCSSNIYREYLLEKTLCRTPSIPEGLLRAVGALFDTTHAPVAKDSDFFCLNLALRVRQRARPLSQPATPGGIAPTATELPRAGSFPEGRVPFFFLLAERSDRVPGLAGCVRSSARRDEQGAPRLCAGYPLSHGDEIVGRHNVRAARPQDSRPILY